MSKKKNDVVINNSIFHKIASNLGGTVIEEKQSIPYYIDTGNLALNAIISGKFIKGGFPGCRIVELYGPASSGKSLIGANSIKGCQKLNGIPIILDVENTVDAEFMRKTSRVDTSKILRFLPDTLESAFLHIHDVTRNIRKEEKVPIEVPILFLYDSISASPCEREFKETELPLNYKPSDWKKIVGRKEQPGERARVCGNELRKLSPILEKENITLVFINQTREKIGLFYGNPETTAGGGNALPFYASVRMRLAAKSKIENKKLKTFAGVNIHAKNIKNKVYKPFGETLGIQHYFDSGINPLTGLLSVLINMKRIVQPSKGNFSVSKEYLPSEVEYTFKASLVRNDINLQVLLDCPKLVDAETSEEVLEYVDPYMDSINCSNSEEFSEKELCFDDEGNPIDQSDEDDDLES